MINQQSVILALAISYAVVGALLLALLIYARFAWQLKAALIVLTSAFYVFDFFAARTLLGWASPDKLPPYFKLLQARVVEPHSQADDAGSIYLWVEALGDDNRPISSPRAYRLPYAVQTAEKAERANAALREGRPQGGLTDDRGLGVGGAADPVKPHVNQEISRETAGGDPASGGDLLGAAPSEGDGLSFTPLLPPRMPPKDQPQLQYN